MQNTSSVAQAPITKVLVANRGEIARRVIRSIHALGMSAVAVYSDADANAAHVREADEAVRLGSAPATESYLNQDAVIAAAVETGAQAVHPGYGFLSENAAFGEALTRAGIAFVGPNERALEIMADKITAKNHVAAAGVPVTPGVAEAGLDDAALIQAAPGVGFPLLIKPSAGGGGQGMVEVWDASELAGALASARRTARSAFGDDTLFLERLVTTPRHIEVQILADQHGNVVHLGERECSLQRRHQKVIEEAPSPLLEGLDAAALSLPDAAGSPSAGIAASGAATLPDAAGLPPAPAAALPGSAIRARLGAAAVEAARSVGYVGAGTVEFLVSDERPDEFFFMEMNTRLQVEHPVTEEVVRVRGSSLDLVAWQIRIAAGEALDFTQAEVELVGHAAEARVYAERPEENFLPAVGPVRHVSFPSGPGVRVDAALDGPGEVSAFYDPMIAKVIAWGSTREQSLGRLDAALANTFVAGSGTNVDYLRRLIQDPDVRVGRLDTGLIGRKPELTQPVALELSAGIASAAAVVLETRAGAGRELLDPIVEQAGSQPIHGAGAGAGEGWEPDGFNAGHAQAPIEIRLRADNGEHLDARLLLDAHGASGEAGRLNWVGAGVTRHTGTTVQSLTADAGEGATGATLVHTGGVIPELWVHAGGTTLHVAAVLRKQRTLEALAQREIAEGGASPQASAPMTGTVSTLHVSTGDTVKVGEPLLAIEAMKMEHPVLAPLDGVVTLHVSVGDQVAQGRVVAEVHAEPTPTEPSSATAVRPTEQEQS